MDFFAAQERAHARTRLLVIYFLLGVTGLIISLYFVVLAGFGLAGNRHAARNGPPGSYSQYEDAPAESNPGGGLWQPGIFILVSLGTLTVVGGACASKIASLHGGGGAVVARSVGATPISPQTTDLGERRLRNIVEEMALASGVPVPEVFVMEEEGINAFAAGFRPEDATVTVTRGALRNLTRDELQGVIGHEFSHILNGDMKLNVEIIGAVFGLMVLAIIGRELLYAMRFSGGRSRNDRGGDPRAALMILSLALIVLGGLGVFFGRLIQAAISRQREHLADASSVQFTRNPAGLADALKKIGGLEAGSRIEHAHVQETAHMYFAPALNSIFDTHPPLEVRIRDLDPHWDGRFITPRPHEDQADTHALKDDAVAKLGRVFGAAQMGAGGLVVPASVAAAAALPGTRAWRDNLTPAITQALASAPGCRALTLALALEDDPTQRDAQIAALRQQNEPAADAAVLLAGPVGSTPPGQRLPLLELALAGLAASSVAEKNSVLMRLNLLTQTGHTPTLHDFALMRVADYRLNPRPPRLGPSDPAAYRDDVSVVLSALAHLSTADDTAALPVFTQGMTALESLTGKVSLIPRAQATLDRVETACSRLEGAPFGFKKQLLETAARVAQFDGIIEPAEAELLRALAASLGCPLPPV